MKQIIAACREIYGSLSRKNKRAIWQILLFLSGLALIDVVALSFLSQAMTNVSTQSLLAKWPLLVIVIGLFVAKNILSAVGSFVTQKKLEAIELAFGEENFNNYNKSSWSRKSRYSEIDFLNEFDRGPHAAIQGVLAASISFVTESVGSFAILCILLITNPLVAITVAVYFVAIFIIQNRAYGKHANKVGKLTFEYSNVEQELATDFHRVGKLLSVHPSKFLAHELLDIRRKLIPVRGSQKFIEALPRFYVEAVLILGLAVVAGISYFALGAASVVSSLAIFGAGGYRLLPTLSRLQTSISLGRISLGLCEAVLTARRKYPNFGESSGIEIREVNFIKFQGVSFTYPGAKNESISDFSFTFEPGKTYALVGSSGAGKTTVADLCLGLWSPSAGTLTRPLDIKSSYVPQDNYILTGTLEKNIAFADSTDLNRNSLEVAVRKAHLDLTALKQRASAPGHRIKLSGGQKQRVGLARAFYRDFNLLVLDEATSALDNKNEFDVMNLLGKPNQGQIFIVVAHRLSTVTNADEILYIDNGKLIAHGSWDFMRNNVPQFAEQIAHGQIK